MKWIAISGGWRIVNSQVQDDVRKTIKEIISQGGGIVSGGALGVDYIATDEALNMNCKKEELKILIPSTLNIYKKHYFKKAEEKIVTQKQTERLIFQLEKVKEKGCLIEGEDIVLNKETYFKRIEKIIENADELIAFHINNTEGTQYTIDKAREKGIPIKIYNYQIE